MAAQATLARRRAAGAAASLVAHVAVLAVLGWSVAPRLRPASERAEPSTLTVQLVRSAPNLRPPQRVAPPPPTPVAAKSRPPESLLARPAVAAIAPEPLRPTPAPPVSASPAPPVTPAGDLRGFLRATVGCDHADVMKLSTVERERCDRGFGVAARTGGKLDMIAPEKRGAYGLQADADERRRAARTGALGSPVVLCEAGGNLGFGCLPPEAIHHFRW